MRLRVSGHFLPGSGGLLATILWEPPPDLPCRFAVLYLPPAGDEMNKARRMVALQARALASLGGAVALLDPRGTGDSAGEHGDATWDGWRADALVAWEWLGLRTGMPGALWGLRLGGLLAADLVASGAIAPAALLFWQPVVSGRAFFTQLLRLATAQQFTGRGEGTADAKSLRALLDSGVSVEVAGYDLNPALVAGAEAIELRTLVVRQCPIIWRETAISGPPEISPAAARIAASWADAGVDLDIAAVGGPSFWATQEIAEAPELIAATSGSLVEQLIAPTAGHL